MSIIIPTTPPRFRVVRLQEKAIRRDLLVLARFVELYCLAHHRDREKSSFKARGTLAPWIHALNPALCTECSSLFLHGAAKRVLCPYQPKPRCKKCSTPCYRSGYREAIKTVMRHSGSRLILRGRLDLLYKYLF